MVINNTKKEEEASTVRKQQQRRTNSPPGHIYALREIVCSHNPISSSDPPQDCGSSSSLLQCSYGRFEEMKECSRPSRPSISTPVSNDEDKVVANNNSSYNCNNNYCATAAVRIITSQIVRTNEFTFQQLEDTSSSSSSSLVGCCGRTVLCPSFQHQQEEHHYDGHDQIIDNKETTATTSTSCCYIEAVPTSTILNQMNTMNMNIVGHIDDDEDYFDDCPIALLTNHITSHENENIDNVSGDDGQGKKKKKKWRRIKLPTIRGMYKSLQILVVSSSLCQKTTSSKRNQQQQRQVIDEQQLERIQSPKMIIKDGSIIDWKNSTYLKNCPLHIDGSTKLFACFTTTTSSDDEEEELVSRPKNTTTCNICSSSCSCSGSDEMQGSCQGNDTVKQKRQQSNHKKKKKIQGNESKNDYSILTPNSNSRNGINNNSSSSTTIVRQRKSSSARQQQKTKNVKMYYNDITMKSLGDIIFSDEAVINNCIEPGKLMID